MRKILLASAGVMVMSAGTGYAACIPTPSCASLGYESSSSCEGGIKCPFGNAWNCTLTDIKNKVTEITNKVTELEKVIEEGGVGSKDTSNCEIGSIFYSDWTCSTSLDSSKTPIAVVVYTSGEGHGQVMTIKSIGNYAWSSGNADVPGLSNYGSDQSAANDDQSCSNTILITSAGDKNAFPAAWAAKEYSTKGTKAGDWCLPAAGIFYSINKNQTAINGALVKTGGEQLLWMNSAQWSSSASSLGAYMGYIGYNSYGIKSGNNTASYSVRPVLEF